MRLAGIKRVLPDLKLADRGPGEFGGATKRHLSARIPRGRGDVGGISGNHDAVDLRRRESLLDRPGDQRPSKQRPDVLARQSLTTATRADDAKDGHGSASHRAPLCGRDGTIDLMRGLRLAWRALCFDAALAGIFSMVE